MSIDSISAELAKSIAVDFPWSEPMAAVSAPEWGAERWHEFIADECHCLWLDWPLSARLLIYRLAEELSAIPDWDEIDEC